MQVGNLQSTKGNQNTKFNIRLPWDPGPVFLIALKNLVFIFFTVGFRADLDHQALENGLTVLGALVKDEAAVMGWV